MIVPLSTTVSVPQVIQIPRALLTWINVILNHVQMEARVTMLKKPTCVTVVRAIQVTRVQPILMIVLQIHV